MSKEIERIENPAHYAGIFPHTISLL